MRKARGFTLIEILLVAGILTLLSFAVVLILNPAELYLEAQDSLRLGDIDTLKNSLTYATAAAALVNQSFDPDGPNYPNDSCAGGANKRIFVSVPSDNGETSPTPPAGWTYARVASADLYKTDGNGWLPVNFSGYGNAAHLKSLPIDPVNTFASGYYYTYACGSFELGVRFASQKYADKMLTDSGDDDGTYEMGTDLALTPLRPAATSTGTTGPSQPAPGVASILPSQGTNDAAVSGVTIVGQNFVSGATIRLRQVNEADIVGTGFSVASSTFITGGSLNITGAAPGNWNITVTNPDEQSGTLANGFTVNSPPMPAPSVTLISPSSTGQGAINQTITISGTNFGTSSVVSFSGVGITINSTSFINSTALQASINVSSGATVGLRDVTVTNADSQSGSCAGCFAVDTGPLITSLSPASSNAGITNLNVAIYGTSFASGAIISFSGTGITVNSTVFSSSSQITATISIDSAAALTVRDITVVNPDGGTYTRTNSFSVLGAAPSITSINPTSILQGVSGQTVDVNGANFTADAIVLVSGSGITVNSQTYLSSIHLAINITVSASAPVSSRNITVINGDSQQGVCSGCLAVTAPPTVSSISPSQANQGATNLSTIITGANFVSGASVSFSGTGITVNSTTFNSSTQITANISVSASALSGARDVMVTNPDGGTKTGTGLFSIVRVQQNTAYLMGSGSPTLVQTWTAPTNPSNPSWFSDENPPTLATQIATATTTSSISPSVTFSGFNFGIPAGASIDKICVNINNVSISASISGTQKWNTSLSWNGGSSLTAENTLAADVTNTTLTGIEQFYKDTATAPGTTDPATSCTSWGRTWLDTEMSASNFAVRVRGTSSAAASAILRFDVIKVKVYYTPQ